MDIDVVSKLDALIDLSRLKLGKLLKSISGSKDITIESTLFRALERICGIKWLRLNEVEKIYKLEDIKPTHSNKCHIYLIPSNLIVFRKVLDQIQSVLSTNNNANYHIIVIPKVMHSFELLLEELGLYDIVQLHSYCWEFIQIDPQILSLEIPKFFFDVFVNEELSLLPSFSQSLCDLLCVTGEPVITVTVGKHAASVLNQISLFKDSLNLPEKVHSDFEVLVIMDRSVDYVSALLTGTTYNSLLSEVFKVTGGFVENKASNTPDVTNKSDSDAQQTQKSNCLFSLDSINDSVYANIKNRHISDVSEILGGEVRQLKSEGQISKDMDLSAMKTYVQTKLQQVSVKSRFLGCHLQACEKIIETLGTKFERLRDTQQWFLENTSKSENIKTIEEFILQGNELLSLRLICLLSLTQRASYDEYNNLKLRYLQQFGYQYLYLFHNLSACGLSPEPIQTKLNLSLPSLGTIRKDFYTIANKFRLIPPRPDLVDLRSPTVTSYVFGGCFNPLLTQLVTSVLCAQSEAELKPKLELINGTISVQNTGKPFPLKRRTVLVCVLGGLTYAEIAACNLVEKLCGCKIVVCSNAVVSGNDLVEACK